MALSKADLIEAVSENSGQLLAMTGRFIKSLAEVLEAELSTTGELTIPGIGRFTVKHKAARIGRNPATGAAMEIAAKNVIVFKPEKRLRDAVN